MLETYGDKLERARTMAWSGPLSDLDAYDRAALQAVLERLEELEIQLSEGEAR